MKVLITGASGGIGAKTAELFLEKGHTVFGMDIREAAVQHANYQHVLHDIRDEHYPDLGEIEILVNSAGTQLQSAEDIPVNLTAAIAVTEFYAVQEKIHAVVHVASASGITGSEFPHYAAAKGGLLSYIRNLAMRIAPFGATANCICPGAVVTDLNRHILEDPNLFAAVTDESLLKRWAQPEEIAEWIYFLSCVNRSMTGESLLMDNGEFINSHFIW